MLFYLRAQQAMDFMPDKSSSTLPWVLQADLPRPASRSSAERVGVLGSPRAPPTLIIVLFKSYAQAFSTILALSLQVLPRHSAELQHSLSKSKIIMMCCWVSFTHRKLISRCSKHVYSQKVFLYPDVGIHLRTSAADGTPKT